MLLKISTTHQPATDLGYLLHKNPTRVQTAKLPFGEAHLFYPEASENLCSVAVLVELDTISMVRNRESVNSVDHYVNDLPYVASSFMSSALLEFFSTAMGGRSKERQELADQAIPLRAEIPVLPCREGEQFLRGLFEPLGYHVSAGRLPLDEQFPSWGDSAFYNVTLEGNLRIRDLLAHLYVLIPVLDERKHYFISRFEVEKLLRRGKDWLATHPLKDKIVRRYLPFDRSHVQEALVRLNELEGEVNEPIELVEEKSTVSENPERPQQLHDTRLETVVAALVESGAQRVLDLGCGEGKLLKLLLKHKQFTDIVGVDVAISALEKAHRRLKIDRLSESQAKRLSLLHGSLVYRDRRLEGYDAAALVEVIEHLDEDRLAALERSVFEFARPRTVIITTPNKEYNRLFETLPEDQMRHADHRFEWTRREFETWCQAIAERHGYAVEYKAIGAVNEQFGGPSQMGIFTKVAK